MKYVNTCKQEQQRSCFFIAISTFLKFFLKICKLCLTIGNTYIIL